MSGAKDCFGLIPTGGGKSLTFQIPAIVEDKVTFCIMPLLALIQDAV
jgi:superfamily II DNA helicase RecQ